MGIKRILYAIGGAFNRLTGQVAPTLYMNEIEDHFVKIFGGKDHRVYHELMSKYVHVDIHIAEPTEEIPYRVLYTTGMSDLPMTLPEDTPWDKKKLNERAELFCILPPEFGIEPRDEDSEEDVERRSWILSSMQMAARFPHKHKCFLGNGHTIRFSEEGKGFTSAVLLNSDSRDFGGKYGDDLGFMQTEDGTYINLLCFIPIFDDELSFAVENDGVELFRRLFGEQIDSFGQLAVDMGRESCCFNKSV